MLAAFWNRIRLNTGDMADTNNGAAEIRAAGEESENPLVAALPPVSDYITYLTIVEYNLTPENLPVLQEVLKDEKLTTNIGWDLVHLLVPHLPDSEGCLREIARLGNPREVILKVTESLRLIDYESIEEDEDDDEDSEEGVATQRKRYVSASLRCSWKLTVLIEPIAPLIH